jgi:hypothetical protein
MRWLLLEGKDVWTDHWDDRPSTAVKIFHCALILVAVTAQANAANPMDALKYYVGRWSCVEHAAGNLPVSSKFVFAMESNLMRQWIARPQQGSMRGPYVVNSTFAYDSERLRYVQTEMDNDAAWYVSAAEPWKGDTIRWVDLATSTKLSRWEMTRIDSKTFTIASFTKPTDESPSYTATCKRDEQSKNEPLTAPGTQ